jgi:hypothetical protein
MEYPSFVQGLPSLHIPRPIMVDYVAVPPRSPRNPLAKAFAEWVRTLL